MGAVFQKDKNREIEIKNKAIEKNNEILSTLLEYFKN